MKRFTALMLMSLMILLANGSLWASDDHKDGYRSKFYGTVDNLPEGLLGTWIVNGRSVIVTERTRIEEEHGRVLVGAYVEIKGKSDGQTLHASKIEVKRDSSSSSRDDDSRHQRSGNEFYGVVKDLPNGDLGTWLIGEREVIVDHQTRIDTKYGRPMVGSRVEVKGSFQNNSFHARKIEVK